MTENSRTRRPDDGPSLFNDDDPFSRRAGSPEELGLDIGDRTPQILDGEQPAEADRLTLDVWVPGSETKFMTVLDIENPTQDDIETANKVAKMTDHKTEVKITRNNDD